MEDDDIRRLLRADMEKILPKIVDAYTEMSIGQIELPAMLHIITSEQTNLAIALADFESDEGKYRSFEEAADILVKEGRVPVILFLCAEAWQAADIMQKASESRERREVIIVFGQTAIGDTLTARIPIIRNGDEILPGSVEYLNQVRSPLMTIFWESYFKKANQSSS
ncbi:MAG: hypothetical protein AAF633_04835 [Chloroflexota bacterium]